MAPRHRPDPIKAELQAAQAKSQFLEAVMDSSYEGVVVVDREGRIIMINRAYADFLGKEPQDLIGRHVTEIIDNTRLHQVAQTGIPEISVVQRIKGQNILGHRIPIRLNGKVIGALGQLVFQRTEEIKGLVGRLNLLEDRIQFYETQLQDILGARFTLDDVHGQSEAIREAKKVALKAARGDSTVLILGESGVGKEIFAHAIHRVGGRARGPFVKVNCAAIPEQLLESELFGYEPGAFTGAVKSGKPGKFELAEHGTIFLDEVGDMSPSMQAKLLRTLQEREIERVGGVKPIPVDVRVIAATNRDLKALVAEGTFRADLYYRLNVVSIVVPPLRERLGDIPEIIQRHMAKVCNELQVPLRHFSPAAMAAISAYAWPGNIRELLNVIERAVNLAEGEVIALEDLPPALRSATGRGEAGPFFEGTLAEAVAKAEREAITQAVEAAGGNKVKAARRLGIHRSTLYEKMGQFGLAKR
ncbi:MAG TPA: sigma 54-interacting transcriptional regulator [Bacillota bacterium]|jgi:PAS domain S-box-containing protein